MLCTELLLYINGVVVVVLLLWSRGADDAGGGIIELVDIDSGLEKVPSGEDGFV